MKIRRSTTALFLLVGSIWGMNAVAMRVASRYAPPLTIATLRSVVGGLLLLAIARARGADWPRTRREWGGIAWVALFMTGLSTAGLFLGAKRLPAGVISIFSNTMPLFTAMLAPFILAERVTKRTMLGLGIGLFGTTLVAWRGIHGDLDALGIVFGLLGAGTAAVGAIGFKRLPTPRLDRLMVVAVQLLISALVLGVLAVPDDRSHIRFPWQLGLSFAYLAVIGLAVSFVSFSALIERGTTVQTSSVAYLSTVMGVLFGASILGERLSPLILLGGVIAVVGVAVVQGLPIGSLRRRSEPRESLAGAEPL